MATDAFDAMAAHIRAEQLSKLLHAEFLLPIYGQLLERFFPPPAPPGGPLCRRQPQPLPQGWNPGKLAKIYDPDCFYWRR